MPLDGVALCIAKHLAPPYMVGPADDAVLLHPLDQPRRAVVADAQLPLDVGGRRLLAFGHDLHGLAVQLALGIVVAIRRAVEHAPAVVDVVTSQDAPSPDAGKGLGFVPDYQALTPWNDAEIERRKEGTS